MIDFLRQVFQQNRDLPAIIFKNESKTYGWLNDSVDIALRKVNEAGIKHGSVVALEADFSPEAIGYLLALIENLNIIVPISKAVGAKKSEFLAVAECEFVITVDGDNAQFKRRSTTASHELYKKLRAIRHPGLVLFSSGSTGKSKAALHDFSFLLNKFRIKKHQKRLMAFLLFDHIGGLNTLLYALSNAGTIVTLEDRSPEKVAEGIEKHKVQILPTSPSFLNLLIMKSIHESYDLSSLELITYGTEVMPQFTLERISKIFPAVKFQQTYGLSEIGIMRSKSEKSDSLWVKIGGEGFQTRVVDGLLEVKAESAMIGYLNAASPFTEDGWFMTGDAVEIRDDYFKILGRRSEIINVGGQKVYPAEVESLLLNVNGVADAVVYGEKHPLLGHIVTAKVRLSTDEGLSEFKVRMRECLKGKCEPFKVPQKVIISDDNLHGARYKKSRSSDNVVL